MTANTVFGLAVDLIDERLSTGVINTNATNVYLKRTPGLLNVWQGELYTKLHSATAPTDIVNMTDNLTYNYGYNAAYFLAANFLITEEPSTAAFFNEKYEETLKAILKVRPAVIEAVTDVYADEVENDFNAYKAIDCSE